MIKELKHKHLTWIDLNSPTKEEVLEVADKYKIHPVVVSELLLPSLRSKVDLYDNFIYLILHFPVENFFDKEATDPKNSHEIDFIIGEDFLITTHYEHVQTIEEFGKVFEASSTFTNRRAKDLHAGLLFFQLIRLLYQSLEPGLEYINANLKKVELKVFSGQEFEMVKTLSQINRSLLDFKWNLGAHQSVLNSLEITGRDFFDDKFGHYLKAVTGEYERIWKLLEENVTTFDELKSTNESMLAIKTSNTTKVLAALAFIFLPMSFITQIFGMSGTDFNMPLIKHPYGFYSTLGLVGLVGIFAYLLVKYKKWL